MHSRESSTPRFWRIVDGVGALVRRHWLLSILLLAGIVLRTITWYAYQPALLYIDSFVYLDNVEAMDPSRGHPLGYTFILRALLDVAGLFGLGGLSFVTFVQHLAGIGMAIALYALARRKGVARWLSALVAGVVLLDGYQLQIEANILSEVWMQAMLVGILWALLGPRRSHWGWALVAGALVGAAIVTRTIAFVVAAPVLVHLLTCGGVPNTWARASAAGVRIAAAAAAILVVVGSYAAYYHSQTGEWRISGIGSNMLYGRAATLADCERLPLTEEMLTVCPEEPVGEREGVDFYTHMVYSSGSWPRGPLPDDVDGQAVATEFGDLVLREQPLDFVGATLLDFAKNFYPEKITFPSDVPAERWHFQPEYPLWDHLEEEARDYTIHYDGHEPGQIDGLAQFLRGYQLSVGYTAGPVLALAALLGTAATFSVGASRRSGLRSAAMVSTGTALALMLGAAAFEFSWRYQLPALVTLPIGGALGLTALMGKRRPDLAPFPDDADARALAAFEDRYGSGEDVGADIVVAIAAYNEGEGIGTVLDEVPRECAGRRVTVLVVVDGASDDTAAVADAHGVYVCDVAVNRGQGAALRLAYHLAHRMGAEFVVTTDADGQYDSRELERLMAPLLDGSADFVTGSRRLGSEEAASRIRWAGTRVFAWLATVLTRTHITDTSFGFRAMPTARAVEVPLREPQYQSSEIMLGMLARGARLTELPMTMRKRAKGSTKKGGSLVYGANYARVMLSTWWRDYVLGAGRRRRNRRPSDRPSDRPSGRSAQDPRPADRSPSSS